MAESDDIPEQNSMLTTGQREFLSKSEDERSQMEDDTVYRKWSRLKKRVHAGMWDFGLLFSRMNSDRLTKFYDGPEPKEREVENPSRISLEGFSDHAANVVAFLYRVLPYPVFLRAVEAGIYRAERVGEEKRMITVNVDPDAIERVYAPTEENDDVYREEELITKLQNGEELTELERMACANIIENYPHSPEGDIVELYDAKRRDGPD